MPQTSSNKRPLSHPPWAATGLHMIATLRTPCHGLMSMPWRTTRSPRSPFSQCSQCRQQPFCLLPYVPHAPRVCPPTHSSTCNYLPEKRGKQRHVTHIHITVFRGIRRRPHLRRGCTGGPRLADGGGERLARLAKVPRQPRLECGADLLCDGANRLRDASEGSNVEAVALWACPGLQLVLKGDPRERRSQRRTLDPAAATREMTNLHNALHMWASDAL